MADEASAADPVQKVIDEDLEESSNWFFGWWIFYVVLIVFMGLGYWTAPTTFPTYYTHIMHASIINAILGVLGLVGLMLHATTGILRPPSFKPPAMNMFETTLTRFGSDATGPGAPPRDEAAQGEASMALVERGGIELGARCFINKVLAPPVATIIARLSGPVIVVVMSLILWLAYGEPLWAGVTVVIGLATTQIQYYTVPSAAMKYVETTFPDLFDVLSGKVEAPAAPEGG